MIARSPWIVYFDLATILVPSLRMIV